MAIYRACLVTCFVIQLVSAAYHSVTVCQETPCTVATHVGDKKAIRVYSSFRITNISPNFLELPACDINKDFCSFVTRISNVTIRGGPLREDVTTLYLVAGGDPISNVALKRSGQDPVFLPRKRKTLPSTIAVEADGMIKPQWTFVRLPLTKDVELSCRNDRGVSIARCVDYSPIGDRCAAKKVCITDRSVAGRAQLYGIVPKVPMDIVLTGSDVGVEKFVVKFVSDATTSTPTPETAFSTSKQTTEPLTEPSSVSPTTTNPIPQEPSTVKTTTTTTQTVTPKPVEPTKGIITVDTGEKSTSGSSKLFASGFLFALLKFIMA